MIANEPLVKLGLQLPNLLLNVHLPVEGLIRSTVLIILWGVNEKDCMPVVDNLMEARVYSVLDYSVEGKEEAAQFGATMEKSSWIDSICRKKNQRCRSVFKPTGLGKFKIWQKGYGTSGLIQFGSSGMEAYPRALWNHLSRGLRTKHSIADRCWKLGCKTQPMRCEQMMERYNSQKAVVLTHCNVIVGTVWSI